MKSMKRMIALALGLLMAMGQAEGFWGTRLFSRLNQFQSGIRRVWTSKRFLGTVGSTAAMAGLPPHVTMGDNWKPQITRKIEVPAESFRKESVTVNNDGDAVRIRLVGDERPGFWGKVAPLYFIHKCSAQRKELCLTEVCAPLGPELNEDEIARLAERLNLERDKAEMAPCTHSKLGLYRAYQGYQVNRARGMRKNTDVHLVPQLISDRIGALLKEHGIYLGHVVPLKEKILATPEQRLGDTHWARERAAEVTPTVPVFVSEGVSNQEIVKVIEQVRRDMNKSEK